MILIEPLPPVVLHGGGEALARCRAYVNLVSAI